MRAKGEDMETEITVQVLQPLNEIIDTVENMGFKCVVQKDINDWYFSAYSSDKLVDMPYKEIIKNSFILREIAEPETYFCGLCYKDKQIDENGNVLCEEKIYCDVEDKQKTLQIFKNANVNNWCTTFNHSYIYQKDEVSFAIQDVAGLGVFIECEENETMKNISSPYEKIEKLKEIVQSFGLKMGDDYFCKKVYMKFCEDNKK